MGAPAARGTRGTGRGDRRVHTGPSRGGGDRDTFRVSGKTAAQKFKISKIKGRKERKAEEQAAADKVQRVADERSQQDKVISGGTSGGTKARGKLKTPRSLLGG
jgi:hypothetical protein